ncbi:MAG: UvrB/UvrC motif-containing protein, partial [Patescibacteria group bacterium]
DVRVKKWQELTPTEYSANVRLAELFLRGKKDDLLKVFDRRMRQAASHQQFELAKLYRDQLRAIERIKDRQIIDRPKNYDQDVINFAAVGSEYVWQIFHVQRGVITGRQRYHLPQLESPAATLSAVISQYYLTRPCPREIIVPITPIDRPALRAYLAELKGRPVIITIPRRGEKKQLLDLVAQNIYSTLEHDAALELQARLGLPAVPTTIDGFDISNISGTEAVGSCVRFHHGQPDKSFYRKFKIKTVTGINDFAMMQEVVSRRYQPAKTTDQKKWGLPDLILIDGGQGQLGLAVRVLKSLQIDRPVLALAKRHEEIFLPGRSQPIALPQNSPARQLLQRVRNEAHRFAIRYHTTLRQRSRRPRP